MVAAARVAHRHPARHVPRPALPQRRDPDDAGLRDGVRGLPAQRPSVAKAAKAVGGPIAVIAGGERWAEGHTLRPAVEDLLGAGAIAHHLGGALSPEARAAEAAFLAYSDDLPAVLSACASGRELTAWGHAADVALASAYGVSATVPRLVDGVYA
ncbi:2-phosphosulfolactate phosphatase [Actinokineospora soli]|uniref:Probable 2-phosphosulfolactate phosphatase n=1 Tax=Actinokineospora soli TaxID=1048753 RepID=A0ABW2TJJ9_9PSEU